MNLKSIVQVSDQLELFTRDQCGPVSVRCASQERHDSPVIEGFFSAVCRERGKLVHGSRREGFNIWTLTGREYLAQLMSYQAYHTTAHNGGSPDPDSIWRDDRIRYVGFGQGTSPEVSSVFQLTSPIEASAGIFLAQLAIPTFPLVSVGGSRTTVRYSRSFSEIELSLIGPVSITEAGLFTDGDPASSYTPKTRDVGITNAASQAPVAYKSFEPIRKTQNFVLEMFWEVRF